MQIGIDSFAASETIENLNGKQNAISIQKLLERIKRSDEVGLEDFGVGEHHGQEMLDRQSVV